MASEADGLIEACFNSLEAAKEIIEASPSIIGARTEFLKETALHHLAVENQIEAVQFLIGMGANVNVLNDCGGTPLSEAASLGHFDMVTLLLAAGAKMDLACQAEPTFIEAVGGGDTRILDALLSHGASLLVRNSLEQTAVHTAASDDSLHAVLVYLVEAAANLEAVNFAGATPLHEASLHGNPRNVEYLLRCGARVDAQDYQGKTPLDYACDSDTESILRRASET